MPTIRNVSSTSGIVSPARGEPRGEALSVFGRGVAGHVDEAKKSALILFGRQLGWRLAEQERRRRQHHHHDHEGHGARIQRAGKAASVPVLEPREGAIHESGETARLAMRLEEFRGHHRRQGHGDDARDHHGAGEGKGEFAEQRSGEALREADRRIHGGERDRHRDDRPEDFLHADDGRIDGFQPFLDMPVNVLENDDRSRRPPGRSPAPWRARSAG